ncbi:CHAP domain-containing protein [Mammaliicoccus vitulinus]|uniref:CHAP domain-containing protein n=1 Tax=Mammaliicoccus vitulinus TaxID=71237 RepID=UPI00248A92EB|nr:CHAP domain-containing protein [Mammaliicoccus vitulinus]
MRKLILKGTTALIFMSSLNVLSNTNTYAQTYNSIDEAKKEHPDAQFNVNQSDGSFTYSNNQTQVPNDNNKPKQNTNTNASTRNEDQPLNQTPFKPDDRNSSTNTPTNDSNNRQQQTPLQEAPEAPEQTETPNAPNTNNAESNPNNESDTDTTVQEPSPPRTNTWPSDEKEDRKSDVTKAFKKDKHGMVTNVDMDELNDELRLTEFNDKAKNEDGEPLAIGNGKIIDNPTYASKNNLYTAGQCTWYVFDKRAKDGKTISTFWGDARNWAGQASSEGFNVDHKPEKGAILQTGNGPFGHVAYVERVNSDGSVFISEMNYVGTYIVSTRTISSAEVGSYNFIH